MREHKYKAKRLDGQWVGGYYFAKPILNQHYILEGENQWMINPDTLCEFTGLYDKNKNMIYEHDIVQYPSSGYKQEVKYGIWDECGCHYTVYGWDIPDCEDIEVISNIFDNPELLEVKQMTREQKVARHLEITKALNQLYDSKGHDYGDSFGETYHKLGIISALTRISDKYNRLVSLATKPEEERKVKDESIQDTLLDLSNYCIMTIIEMEAEKENA